MENSPPVQCLNCGRSLNGNEQYCPSCGQSTHTKRLSIQTFITSFFDNYLALDSKWLRSTLRLLAKPGFIASKYVEGQRVRYTHPFRMLFAVTLIYFFVVGFLQKKTEHAPKQIVEVNFKVNDHELALTDTLSFGEKIAEMTFQLMNHLHEPDSAELWLSRWGLPFTDENLRAYRWAAQLARLLGSTANRQNFVQYLTSKISWAFFLFLPLFGLIIYPLFYNTKRNYAEQLVLIFYVQSAFFLGMLISVLLNAIWPFWLWSLVMWGWFVYYLVQSYRVFFGFSVWAVLRRMLIIVPLYLLMAAMSAIFTVMLGLWMWVS